MRRLVDLWRSWDVWDRATVVLCTLTLALTAVALCMAGRVLL